MIDKLTLVGTPGDPARTGPEITWMVIQSGKYAKKGISLLCVAAKAHVWSFQQDKASRNFGELRNPRSPRRP
jgi:hypothetical protein